MAILTVDTSIMPNCRMCLYPLHGGETHEEYHDRCLQSMFGSTNVEPVLSLSSDMFHQQKYVYSRGVSIPGFQPKLSARLDNNELALASIGGLFIVKPSPPEFSELAENEHISMEIGRLLGIHVPPAGLFRFKDSEDYCYIIRRFDRDLSGNVTLHVEDMMQLMDSRRESQESKYNSDYGTIGQSIYSSSGARSKPVISYFVRIIHSFLVGNGDLHMKNISMQKPVDNPCKYYQELSPLYDVVNTKIYNNNEHTFALDLLPDEIPLKAFEYNGFETGKDILQIADYIGIKRAISQLQIRRIANYQFDIRRLIEHSFMSHDMKSKYLEIFNDRLQRLIK